MASLYDQLGIDARKKSVKRTFEGVISNDFPGAFCNIIRDPHDHNYVLAKHPDGDGSKFMQRLLDFKINNNPMVLRGAVDDALSMNTGDLAAAGLLGPCSTILLTDIININASNVSKSAVMEQVKHRIDELLALYSEYGLLIFFMGGETADLPGQVNSIVFDMDISVRTPANCVIPGNISPGDTIFGFYSDGRAAWETGENSGIMSNGLTLARIVLMDQIYNCYRHLVQAERPYRGQYLLNAAPEILNGMTVSEALLSPTRQWAILIHILIEELKKQDAFDLLHGISMNTGGGATKVGNLGSNIHYIKQMPTPPPFFRFIQQECGEEWGNMFVAFNCGIGIDLVGDNADGRLERIIARVAECTNVQHCKLGHCEPSTSPGNEITLETEFGTFH